MGIRRELQNILQSNTGSYRQRSDEAKPQPTYGQQQLEYQQQGVLNKGATNRYYYNLDKWHRETLRRVLDPAQSKSVPGGEEALAFRLRCIRRGIPPDILTFSSILKVTATRSIGYGSPQLRDMATKELVGMIPYMDEIGRNHALRARASSLPGIGMHSVDSFFPPIEKKGFPNAHTALATLENNALKIPDSEVTVEPQQNHSIHFDTHAKSVAQTLQNPQATPMQKFVHAEQAGRHMQQHLQLLEGDPTRKAEVKDKQKQLTSLSKMTDQLHQNLQDQIGAQMKENGQQAPPQAPDPKAMKVQGDLALKARKQQGDMALKERKQAHAEALSDKKTAAGIRRENAKTRASMARSQFQQNPPIR
jgi:hypothetical protein